MKHGVLARRCVPLCTALSLALGAGLPGHVLAASSTSSTSWASWASSFGPAATGTVSAGTTAGTTTEPAAATPSGTTSPADQASAADSSAQARERFRAKDYDAAVRLFEQAYALDPNPNYLFNIGRVYEEKRDLRAAVDHYQRFVMEPAVDIGAREQAVQRLRVLKAILNETEPQPTKPGTVTTAPMPGTPTEDAAPPPADPKKGMRLGGYALLGAGAVTMIVGGVFGGLTLAKRNQLDDSRIVEDRRSLAHQGHTFAVVTDITLFTGAALAVTGLALVLVARKSRAPSRSAVVPSVGRGHAGLTWSVRF